MPKVAGRFALVPADWAVLRLPPGALMVWIVLFDHRNKRGQAWPSVRRLAALTGLGLSTVKRGINWLHRHNYILKIRPWKDRNRVIYGINWHSEVVAERYARRLDEYQESRKAKFDPGMGSGMTPPRGHKRDTEAEYKKQIESPSGLTALPPAEPPGSAGRLELQPYRHPLAPDPEPDQEPEA